MCSYPTHLYFAKPLTTPWVDQSMATIHRMAHPLRIALIASGTLLLFHSETVTSTSRSNLSLHMSNIPGINTTHWSFPWILYSSKISFIMLLVTIYPLVTLWVVCTTFEANLLQNSSSVVVLQIRSCLDVGIAHFNWCWFGSHYHKLSSILCNCSHHSWRHIQIRMISCILLFETLRQISLDGSGINKVRGAGAGAGGLLDASCI